MGKKVLVESRVYVAVGSTGDYNACLLDWYHLPDAVNKFNPLNGELNCILGTQFMLDLEHMIEERGEFAEKFTHITDGRFPFLEVGINFKPDIVSGCDIDRLAEKFQLRLLRAVQSEHTYNQFAQSEEMRPSPQGIEGSPDMYPLRLEGHEFVKEAMRASGGFRPFGLALDEKDQLIPIAIEDKTLDAENTIEALWNGLKNMVNQEPIKSVAVIHELKIQNERFVITHLENRIGIAIMLREKIELGADNYIDIVLWPIKVVSNPIRVFKV